MSAVPFMVNRGGAGMQEKVMWLAYAIAAISGGAGGCMVAAHKVLHGRAITGVLATAYAFAGAVFGVAGVIALVLFDRDWHMTFEAVALSAFGFGLVGAVALAGVNLSARFVLRRFGIEVDVEVRRIEKKESA